MPSGPQLSRTCYDILGVNRTASADEIKKRYRELARTLHPDVNPGDPKASEKFAEVTTAYKTLSDTLARSNYDAELSLQERRAEAARARSAGTSSYATYATQAPRPGTSQTSSTGGTNYSPPNNADEAVRLASQARTAISRARYVEARDLAQRSLRIKRTAEGYEVLGDVYRMQGRNEEAINMYTMSLQLNPRNGVLMERLQRLARGGTSPRQERRYDARSDSPHPTASSNRNPPPPPRDTSAPPYPTYSTVNPRPASFAANLAPEKRPLLLMMAILFGYGTTFLLLMSLLVFWHEAPSTTGPIPFALFSKWSGPLITVLIGCGVSTGWAMSTTGAVRRLEDELIFSRSQSGFIPPVGPILLLLSAISFWAAALIHILLSVLQEARIAGILRAFGVVAAIVVAAALFYDEAGRGQILLFGGNVVFLSFIFGWFIGDLFRND